LGWGRRGELLLISKRKPKGLRGLPIIGLKAHDQAEGKEDTTHCKARACYHLQKRQEVYRREENIKAGHGLGKEVETSGAREVRRKSELSCPLEKKRGLRMVCGTWEGKGVRPWPAESFVRGLPCA